MQSIDGVAQVASAISAPDLVCFARALQGHELLRRPYTELYISGKVSVPPMPGGPDPGPSSQQGLQAYGLVAPIFNTQRVISHGGGIGGGNTNWAIYLDTDWVGVILSNYDLEDFETLPTRERHAVTGYATDE